MCTYEGLSIRNNKKQTYNITNKIEQLEHSVIKVIRIWKFSLSCSPSLRPLSLPRVFSYADVRCHNAEPDHRCSKPKVMDGKITDKGTTVDATCMKDLYREKA